jgi:hypothetical protein
MLTVILLVAGLIVAGAAYVIVLNAKRRPDGTVTRAPAATTDSPTVGRATGGGDD